MNYDNNTFFKLMDDAAEQGAEHLDAICTMRNYELTGKKKVPRNGPIPGCGQAALFNVPFEALQPEGSDEPIMIGVTVCAVDDAMGAFPRFGGNRLASLSQRELFFVQGDKLEKDDPRVLGR